MASSGMGSAEVRSLKFEDLVNSLKNYPKIGLNESTDIGVTAQILPSFTRDIHVIPTWDITRIKTGKPYYTFSTPESLVAIMEYLVKDSPQNMGDPLFRDSQAYYREQKKREEIVSSFMSIVSMY